jgi:hypothetical protein
VATSAKGITGNNGDYTYHVKFAFQSTPLPDGSYGTTQYSLSDGRSGTGVVECVLFVGGGMAYAMGTMTGTPGENWTFFGVKAGGPGVGYQAGNAFTNEPACPSATNLSLAGSSSFPDTGGTIRCHPRSCAPPRSSGPAPSGDRPDRLGTSVTAKPRSTDRRPGGARFEVTGTAPG